MLRKFLFLLLIFSVALGACNHSSSDDDNSESDQEYEEPGIETAKILDEEGKIFLVRMHNTKGEKIGEARLVEKDKGVEISLLASHLPPGKHGFHIHEKGKCQPPTFGSAEGHFNPTDANHGFNDPEGPHAGDLPNIEVDEDGTVEVTVLADMVTLEQGKENSLLKKDGTSLMIHEKADDYQSQPAGDAGDRIACGVIAE